MIDPAACNNCPDCLVGTKCEKAAVIRESADEKPWIDFYKCSGCMKCTVYCGYGAVTEISRPCTGKAAKGW
jgi:MinD superfamily P-loop ATPase